MDVHEPVPGQLNALIGLGDALRDLGTRNAARRAWQEAMDLLATADYPQVDAARTRLQRRLAPPPDRGTRQAARVRT